MVNVKKITILRLKNYTKGLLKLSSAKIVGDVSRNEANFIRVGKLAVSGFK